MPIVTLFAAIRANPKPTILFLLHCIKKVLANLYINRQLIQIIQKKGKKKKTVEARAYMLKCSKTSSKTVDNILKYVWINDALKCVNFGD